MAEDIRKMTNPEGIAEFDRGYTVPDCVVLGSRLTAVLHARRSPLRQAGLQHVAGGSVCLMSARAGSASCYG